jgi:AraC-like DNA-binding protein
VNQHSSLDPWPDEKIHSAAQLLALIEQLDEEGIGAKEALERMGLPAAALTSPDVRVSRSQLLTAVRRAAQLSRDAGFVSRVGARIHVSSYGLYGFAMMSSTDFRRTMTFMVQYHQLAAPLAQLRFRESQSEATWTIEPLAHALVDGELYRLVVELQFAICVSLHRDIMGEAFRPSRIEVVGEPASGPNLGELFGCPILFGRRENALVFDARWLDARPKFGNAVAHADLVRLCGSLLADMERRIGVVGRVRRTIMPDLTRPVRLDEVARQLGMSGRALRRRLGDENTSFRRVAEELKRDMALRYLCDTSLTVDDVAHLLGFSEPSSFRHAFRRWTGRPPSHFRTPMQAEVRMKANLA